MLKTYKDIFNIESFFLFVILNQLNKHLIVMNKNSV